MSESKETYLGVQTTLLSDFVTQYAKHVNMISPHERLEILETETADEGLTVFRCTLYSNRKELN